MTTNLEHQNGTIRFHMWRRRAVRIMRALDGALRTKVDGSGREHALVRYLTIRDYDKGALHWADVTELYAPREPRDMFVDLRRAPHYSGHSSAHTNVVGDVPRWAPAPNEVAV